MESKHKKLISEVNPGFKARGVKETKASKLIYSQQSSVTDSHKPDVCSFINFVFKCHTYNVLVTKIYDFDIYGLFSTRGITRDLKMILYAMHRLNKSQKYNRKFSY